MWTLFYDVFMSDNFLGGAAAFESTQIIARYMATACSIVTFFGCFALVYLLFKVISSAFRG